MPTHPSLTFSAGAPLCVGADCPPSLTEAAAKARTLLASRKSPPPPAAPAPSNLAARAAVSPWALYEQRKAEFHDAQAKREQARGRYAEEVASVLF